MSAGLGQNKATINLAACETKVSEHQHGRIIKLIYTVPRHLKFIGETPRGISGICSGRIGREQSEEVIASVVCCVQQRDLVCQCLFQSKLHSSMPTGVPRTVSPCLSAHS